MHSVAAAFAALALAGAPPAKAPEPAAGVGGPYEPVEPAIVVEGKMAPTAAWTIAPDPTLGRRYAPPAYSPRNRIILRF